MLLALSSAAYGAADVVLVEAGAASGVGVPASAGVRVTQHSVVATDHKLSGSRALGYGLEGDPRTSFATATPGFSAQTAEQRARNGVNIYVFPNPATNQSLAEFQQLEPNAQDPTGVRIAFVNLPQARNHIEI